MNLDVLKQAENKFLARFPGGFMNPEMIEVGKKHKMDKMTELAKQNFSKEAFKDSADLTEDMIRLISRSSMVSVFEKPKFRDTIKVFNSNEKQVLTDALFEILHGKQKAGFELFVSQLLAMKLAKWTLVTAIPAYYRPQKEVFVKPTTAKLIIERLELDMQYKPTPTWQFYRDFKKVINAMKPHVDKSLAPNNPAFCGFLMSSL
jgi:hypothetical protein